MVDLRSGRARLPMLVVLWLFVLENVWFPAQQQEYGVLAVAAWDRGAPEAEPILLQFAADQIGRPIDRAAVLHFALPMPPWVYPVWLLAAGGLVLVLARWMIGRPWAATVVAGGYVAYRCVAWVALCAVDFPASAVPFVLLAVGVAIDVAFLVPLPEWLRPVLGALLVGTAATGTMVVQHEWASLPPIGPIGLVTGTLLLAALWIATVLGVRTQAFARWARPRRGPPASWAFRHAGRRQNVKTVGNHAVTAAATPGDPPSASGRLRRARPRGRVWVAGDRRGRVRPGRRAPGPSARRARPGGPSPAGPGGAPGRPGTAPRGH
jgi:hypothetical protein